MIITFYNICYICSAKSEVYTADKPNPEGWRRVWRGFRGYSDICPDCTKANRNYYKDLA
jgi:hypothetical protein